MPDRTRLRAPTSTTCCARSSNRVNGALDEQERLRLLLDAVVSMAADLSLDGVLAADRGDRPRPGRRAVRRPGRARTPGPRRACARSSTTAWTRSRWRRSATCPTGHGLLGLLIDQPEPLRLHDIAAHPAVLRLPAEPPADELVPRGPGPDPGPGVRQPLPDREGRGRRLHPAGRGDRRRARGRGRRRHRERPPLRGGGSGARSGWRRRPRSPACSPVGDAGEDALQLVADRARRGRRAPTSPGSWSGTPGRARRSGPCPGRRSSLADDATALAGASPSPARWSGPVSRSRSRTCTQDRRAVTWTTSRVADDRPGHRRPAAHR